jgi:hypothetical protein
MTKVYDPFGSAEFAVELLDGETPIGVTLPSRNADDAKQALRKLTYAYPDSRIVWRYDSIDKWEAVDDEALDRMAYRRTAALLASLIGEGLAKVNWSLSSTSPRRIEGHLVREEGPREALEAYANLLDGELTELPHLNGKVKITAQGTYHGLSVEVWDLVTPDAEQPAAQAEAVA